ncbi:putative RhoGEF domain containing protein [Blattamonas nauphoetae]|uniref:RhoGEF domain containing protein n=1 Tax=Blattamonas nauphoetae TaxID=2049346 RepID=A0ABQ9X5P2_9EUKA|nr:putative RhoGEF domain containing protein [Blattamonas nauphoetae]
MKLITFVLLVVLLLGAFYFVNLLQQDDKPSEGTRKTTETHDSSETEITPNAVSEIVSAPISSPPILLLFQFLLHPSQPQNPPPTIVSLPPQHGQPTPDESEKVAKRAQQRVFILAEILSTEKTYVAQLQAFHDVFSEPCRSRREQLSLSEMDIKSIFSQLTVILSTNLELLKQLQVSIEENGGEGVGKEIASMSVYLRCYTPSINNYTNSQNTIAELQKNNKAFRKFLMECSQDPASLNFPIESFLILPVQRLPRYKMLIKQLLKNTEMNHQKYSPIKSALTTISNLAEQANNRCFENQKQMGVIDFLNSINEGLQEQKKDVSTIDGSAIVTPLRRLLQKLRVITFTRTRQTDIAIPAGTDEAGAPETESLRFL